MLLIFPSYKNFRCSIHEGIKFLFSNKLKISKTLFVINYTYIIKAYLFQIIFNEPKKKLYLRDIGV